MTAQTLDWPADTEWTYCPTDAELDQERQYWQMMDRAAELDAWTELEHEYSEDCDCSECCETRREHEYMDAEYEALTRGW